MGYVWAIIAASTEKSNNDRANAHYVQQRDRLLSTLQPQQVAALEKIAKEWMNDNWSQGNN